MFIVKGLVRVSLVFSAAMMLFMTGCAHRLAPQYYEPVPGARLPEYPGQFQPAPEVVVVVTKSGYTIDGTSVPKTSIKPLISAKIEQNRNTIVKIYYAKSQNIEGFEYALDQIEQANAPSIMIAEQPVPKSQEKR